MSVTTTAAAAGIDVLTADVEIPGLGHLPINAYVLHGAEPVLVDTGSVVQREEFLDALRTVVDVADLRWLWLTHTDFDHIGLVATLLEENPRMRVATTFLGVGIMGLFDPLPMDRVNFVNPGDALTLADRTLTAVRPPAFDNPITTGFVDDRTGALFSSDCFGALLPGLPERADDLDPAALRDGQIAWTSIDSPWLHTVEPAVLAATIDATRAIEPRVVLSAHLAPASGELLPRLLEAVAAVPAAPRFSPPDQQMLDAMLAEMAVGTPA